MDCKSLGSGCIVTANSNGSIGVFNKTVPTTVKRLNESNTLSNNNSLEAVQMAIDVDKNTGMIATCNDAGNVHIVDSQTLSVSHAFKAHTAECWSIAFQPSCASVFVTGADDALIRVWDQRTSLKKCVNEIQFHKHGVCGITWSPFDEHSFSTGSYDNTLALWDMRNIISDKDPKPRMHQEFGGGVWRVDWHPQDKDIVCVTCMYAGNALFNMRTMEIVTFDAPNKFISYAGKFVGIDKMVTCSFYDGRVSQWQCSVLF